MTGRSLSGAIRAEWLKVTGLRSTWLILALATVAGVAVGVLTLHSTARAWAGTSPADRAAFDPVADAFTGFQFTQLAFGGLGILVMTTEFVAGGLETTFIAVPRRLQVLVAKAVVLVALTLPLCLVTAVTTFLLGQRQLLPVGLAVGLGSPMALRATVAAALILTAVGLIGLGLGSLLRHTGAALGALVCLVFLSWPAARAAEGISHLPDRWVIPNLVDGLVATRPATGPDASRTPTVAMATVELFLYVVVILALGALRTRRDP